MKNSNYKWTLAPYKLLRASIFPDEAAFNFWSLDLLEAIQGIAFQGQKKKKTFSCNLLNFSVFRHVFISSLDMFKNCINSYHIDSEQV